MDFNKYIQARKAENEKQANAAEKLSFWQKLKKMAKFDIKNTKDVIAGQKSLLQAVKDRSAETHKDMMSNATYRDAVSTAQGIKDAVKAKVDQKIASNDVLTRLKENIKEGIKDTAISNELHHKYEVTETGVREKASYWQRLKNIFTGKKSLYSEVRDNVKGVRKADTIAYGTYSGVRKTLNELRVSKPGQYTGVSSAGVEKENSTHARIVAMQNTAKEVQIHGDVYHALETYAKISAIEELQGLPSDSGIAFNGMDKSASMDVLKKASPRELQQALSSFKSGTDKGLPGNAGLNAKMTDVADKLPEWLAEQRKSNGLAAKTLSPEAQSLQAVFDNISQYKEANVYDSSEKGQSIYNHKEKDFMSDMQKIVDIYRSNPNDSDVCDLLKDNLSLLSQAAVSAASHQEVDKMSALMFELGQELQGNDALSVENKAKVYEGLANMTNYEGENGRHYNPFTKSSQFKDSLAELMEKANPQDKEMFYGKLTDKKLFEYNINYEKQQPQMQTDAAIMKRLKVGGRV